MHLTGSATAPPAEPRDRLTGLLLAPGALGRIGAWDRAAGERGERAFVHAMLLRLKNFSAINLAHGDLGGDEALMRVARRLLHFAGSEFAGPWLVARVAGDAFLLALDESISRERWQWLAEELSRRIARPIAQAGELAALPIRLRPRIALSRSIAGEEPVRLLSRLTEALEIHQDQPLRCPVWVDGTLSPAGRGGVQLEADLAAALEQGQIEIVYQPQFGCDGDRIIGAEALARWHHPLLGPIGPEALFAIAERADLVPQVSRQVMRAALADARAWPAPLGLSLNVTPADLHQRGFDTLIAQLVAEAGLAPAQLVLEITEKALVCDLDRSAASLKRLAAAGVRIALDDFGAGFCNFRYLKLLPLSGLKLDRAMVEGIADDPRDLAVLRAIVAMAGALDLAVTAEGIETAAQRDAVAREGCASWQGFLGAHPLTAEEFGALAKV